MNQIAKIAKQIDEATEDAQKEAKPMTDEGWEKESKGEYFDRVMRSSSSLDRVLEFLRFRKKKLFSYIFSCTRHENTQNTEAIEQATEDKKHKNTKNTSNEIRIKNERKNTKTHEKHVRKHKQLHYNQN